MSFTDPIADMITRIRNAQLRTLNKVSIPNSKFRARILDVLKEEGYISDYKTLTNENNKKSLMVDLKYQNRAEESTLKLKVYQKFKVGWA